MSIFFQTKVLNWYQNSPKNANITLYIKKKEKTLCNTLNWYQNSPKNANITLYIKKKEETLCNTLNWGNWNSGFVKLDVWWAEGDIKR